MDITWDYRAVQFLYGTSPDVRRKLLEHEAEYGWVYVGSVRIDDDDHLVLKKGSAEPGIAAV